ncbi:unnamed protein product [Spirodela intermedia]|uniref:Uncharacterized protein n=1 Tax=Spirodela intermedia TaxID=51605 RepID=A0A7I8JPX4_SPIIN|nr:unnamed protein product [Spirodela intermedia]CAA6671482.1 unnamed protein product [Spirodela intermedia]
MAQTRATPSRAARARMSAQETVEGQAASTRVLMSSMTLKPRTELLFGRAVFSPVNVDVKQKKKKKKMMWTSRTLTKQSWKRSRTMEAPILGSRLTAWVMAPRTIPFRFGQLRE